MVMTAVYAFFIVTTTFSVVNDVTVDRKEYSRITKYESYSECRRSISDKKQKFSEQRKDRDHRYIYNYKTIQCERRKILEYNNIFKK